MTPTEQEKRVLANVLSMLGSGQALVQDIEDYVVGYAVLGNLVAAAQGEAETAEMEYKVEWARLFSEHKESKLSDAHARAQADIGAEPFRKVEIKKREQLTKLKGARDAVQEAIWAIKYLGKNGG